MKITHTTARRHTTVRFPSKRYRLSLGYEHRGA